MNISFSELILREKNSRLDQDLNLDVQLYALELYPTELTGSIARLSQNSYLKKIVAQFLEYVSND